VDDRDFYLALAVLGLATFAIGIDAVSDSFQVPTPFWAIPGGVIAWLTRRSTKAEREEGER
jgi:membrane protein implicated in regulation of membrane protease activity